MACLCSRKGPGALGSDELRAVPEAVRARGLVANSEKPKPSLDSTWSLLLTFKRRGHDPNLIFG